MPSGLNHARETEIANVIYEYGEERASRRIAKAIVNARVEDPITTTSQLADLVRKVVPAKKARRKSQVMFILRRKTFQALRIYINRELEEIRDVLPQAVDVLCPGGRLAAISFHSLEDRIVKRFMRDQSTPKAYPPEIPIMPDNSTGIQLKLIGKKIRATKEELNENPRSRSATLRVAERISS